MFGTWENGEKKTEEKIFYKFHCCQPTFYANEKRKFPWNLIWKRRQILSLILLIFFSVKFFACTKIKRDYFYYYYLIISSATWNVTYIKKINSFKLLFVWQKNKKIINHNINHNWQNNEWYVVLCVCACVRECTRHN